MTWKQWQITPLRCKHSFMTKQLLTFDLVQQRESHDSLHKFPVRMCVCEVCVCVHTTTCSACCAPILGLFVVIWASVCCSVWISSTTEPTMATMPNTRPPLNLRRVRGNQNLKSNQSWNFTGGWKKASPQVEGSGVDASAVREQPVEHGCLPSHVERRQHQPSAGQPGLVTEPMRGWRLQTEKTRQVKGCASDGAPAAKPRLDAGKCHDGQFQAPEKPFFSYFGIVI